MHTHSHECAHARVCARACTHTLTSNSPLARAHRSTHPNLAPIPHSSAGLHPWGLHIRVYVRVSVRWPLPLEDPWYVYTHTYIYGYIYMHMWVYIFIYIYIQINSLACRLDAHDSATHDAATHARKVHLFDIEVATRIKFVLRIHIYRSRPATPPPFPTYFFYLVI